MADPSRTASVGDGLDGLKRVGLPASAYQRPTPPLRVTKLKVHWSHGISAALLGVLILLLAQPASAQSRDDFAYWDANGNGDLTCAEAGPAPGGRDEGLRLPAYQDNRDGTGVIYEWLERSRSSDTTATVSAVTLPLTPTVISPVQVEPPVEPLTCSADAETWRGLQVCDERPRDGYDRDAFGTGYSSLEDEIIAALPPTMKANGQVYTPYSCLAFDITAAGTAATNIEHIVALAETHDSCIADDRRRDIASDLDNLTIADPTVNRSEKSDRDAAEWMPARHGAWFAERVIQVKLEYGLSIDSAERDALEELLADGGAQLNCVDAVAPTPTMLTLSTASAPAEGGTPVTVTATLDTPAPANGMTVTLTTGGTATLDTDYTLSSTTITLTEGETAGTVTITVTDDAEDDDGETIVIDAESTSPALTAEQLTLTIEDNDVTPVPALPLGGAMLLGHCQLGVDSALLRLEVVRPRSFSTHTSPHPIRRTPAFGTRGGASTGLDVTRLERDSAQLRVPMRTVARGRPT